MKKRKLLKWTIGLSVIMTLGIVAGINLAKNTIEDVSRGKVISDVQMLPKRKVALVLGCAKKLPDGRSNLYFIYRMRAAHKLYKSGKVEYILVSGDNSIKSYDESSDMKDALVGLGIPEERVICDFAGFSTLDSVVRAKKVFQEDSLFVVSQDFHARRAIYIGQAHGVDLIGYPAKDVSGTGGFKTRMREHLARFKTVLDVNILNRSPKYLGDPISIGKEA